MQKSKKLTICMIVFITAYFIFNKLYLTKFGLWYLYLINPLTFILLAVMTNILIKTQLNMHKNRWEITQYIMITVLIYIILYLISGLFSGYADNPYDNSFRGILLNFLSTAPVIVCIEYIRFKLINNVTKRDRYLIAALIVVAFSLWDLNLVKIINTKSTPYTIFALTFYSFIPVFVENTLFTYVSYKSDYMPIVVYKLIFNIMLWTVPILPNLPWIFEAILSTLLPFFLLLYVRYFVNRKDKYYAKQTIKNENPGGLIPFTVALVVIIWFTLGAFPTKPVGVATGSMYPNLHVGDMVILNKFDIHDLKEDDIIGYKLDGITVVHRVKSISKNSNGDYVVITKGDNNSSEDAKPVIEDQIIGKVVFKVRYIAYPTIWLHSLQSGRQDVGVETGNV